MDPITQQTVLAAAGAAGGDPVYVDDVFSTFLYEGNNSTQAINNGIDVSGEGGLIWIKNRDSAQGHFLVDTERGNTKMLYTNRTDPEGTITGTFSINSTGFTNGGTVYSSYANTNHTGDDYASWTFRKAPGFFDVVTYTGNSTAGRTISHNLGSVPGFIMVKATSGLGGNWVCYHRSLGNGHRIYLNSLQAAEGPNKPNWNQTSPTSTEFTVGPWGYSTNDAGVNYVAYLFAHDVADFGTNGNESIIKCDSYVGNNTAGHFIDLGFEPQWLLLKNADHASEQNTDQPWFIYDNIRGVVPITNPYAGSDMALEANSSNTETGMFRVEFSSRGFTLKSANDENFAGDNFIYVAIRRPHKPPEAATEVFKPVLQTTRGTVSTGFPVDLVIKADTSTDWAFNWTIQNRLTGPTQLLFTSRTDFTEQSTASSEFDSNTGFKDGWLSGGVSGIYHNFRRAPGFYDTVAYTGDNTANQQFAHNLGVAPELIITKARNSYFRNFAVYSSVTGTGKWLQLNDDSAVQTGSGKFDTAPTSTGFYVSHDSSFMTGSSLDYVAHLFATLAGISKVGSYTGTGSAINVDCGFTAGARYVMIKRTDSTGHWVVFDSARGITSGNDPFGYYNNRNANYTNYDYIDPLNSGFTLTSATSGSGAINASGGTYLFFAIA